MVVNFDYFNKFEKPKLSLCNPNNKVLGMLDTYTKNLKITPTFNAVWEMSVDIYKSKRRNKQDVPLLCYDLIESKRQIFIDNVGYFLITKVEKNDDKTNNQFKTITAVSCEIEIASKKLNYFEGTYKFYDAEKPDGTLMGETMKYLPRWTLGHVDISIAEKFRTFDKPDTTVFEFFMKDVEEAYDCLFKYNKINRIINVYDKLTYSNKTSILLSKDETIDTIKISDDNTKIVTALNVFGQNDLDIRSVNPIGTNVIYNFDYYKNSNWMSDELVSAINTWETKIESSETLFQSTLLNLKNQNIVLDTLNQELMSLNLLMNGYKTQQNEAIKNDDSAGLTTIGGYITTTQSNINAKQSQIDAQQIVVDGLVNTLNSIHNDNNIENNFTEEQYSELSVYINQNTYNDQYITKTGIMTYAEVQAQELELYNKAKQLLSEVSQPNYEYEVSTNNFIFDKRFLPYTNQLQEGCLINIEIEEDNFVELILLKMDIDYEEKTISLTFGNRYKLNDPLSVYSDIFANMSESANTVNYERANWNKTVKTGLFDKATAFIDSPIDLTKNALIDANGNTLLDNSGYKGQTPDGKEIRLIDNMMFISNDNFISDSKKLVDDTGVLSSFVFPMKAGLIGCQLDGGGLFVNLNYANQGFEIYIPENFTVTKSILRIIIIPEYCQNIDNGGNPAFTGWGYPRNVKCYLTTTPNRMAGHRKNMSMTDFIYNIQNNGNFIDKTTQFFGVTGITPYVDQSWDYNSNSTDFSSPYTSVDIKDHLVKGYNTIGFAIASMPSYNNENYVTIQAQYSGYISATLTVEGYTVIS